MSSTNLFNRKVTRQCGKEGLIYGALHKSRDLVGSYNKVRVIKCLTIRYRTLEMKNV